jgi:hypothetical protein
MNHVDGSADPHVDREVAETPRLSDSQSEAEPVGVADLDAGRPRDLGRPRALVGHLGDEEGMTVELQLPADVAERPVLALLEPGLAEPDVAADAAKERPIAELEPLGGRHVHRPPLDLLVAEEEDAADADLRPRTLVLEEPRPDHRSADGGILVGPRAVVELPGRADLDPVRQADGGDGPVADDGWLLRGRVMKDGGAVLQGELSVVQDPRCRIEEHPGRELAGDEAAAADVGLLRGDRLRERARWGDEHGQPQPQHGDDRPVNWSTSRVR